MKPHQRQTRILDLLRALHKELRVEELADIFGVSGLTIRRDLDVLSEEGRIIRTHGGCISADRGPIETAYYQKVARNFELKRGIAETAVGFIEDGEAVLLNDGSTTFHVGVRAGLRGGCRIYTNSLALVFEYGRFSDTHLYFLAGEYDGEYNSVRGSLTEQVLENLHFDRVFLGTDAIDESGRCLVANLDDARLAQIMLRSAGHRILVADHTKLSVSSHVVFGELSDFDAWIVSDGLSKEEQETMSRFTTIVRATPIS
jgi:DeoR family fructose operon transcriptional repressor